MDKPIELMRDERPITSIWYMAENGGGHEVGSNCSRIEAYGEPGQMADVPWIAIYDKDGVILRVGAHHVSIHY